MTPDVFGEDSFVEFPGQYDTLLSTGRVPSYTAPELTARADSLFSRTEGAGGREHTFHAP